jgi:hypothetical protein
MAGPQRMPRRADAASRPRLGRFPTAWSSPPSSYSERDFLTRLLHDQTPLIIQRRLQNAIPMLILPMKL